MKPTFASEKFAARVRKARGQISRRAVAAKIGISQSTLARAEAGARPDLNSLMALCRWMGANVNEFFDEP